ncbi:MAG: hypothetical protein ACREYF_14265 [Gammaproteobacteria bacterium]
MSITGHFGASVGLVMLLGAVDVAYAQKPPSNSLVTATRIDCVFPLLATGTWTSGEPRAEVKPAKLSFAVDSINTQESTARAVGTFGPVEIIARLSSNTLHLLQVSNDGPMYMTTVFNKVTRDGKLQAVHTRHEYTEVVLPGFTSRPEQYYGECTVKQQA